VVRSGPGKKGRARGNHSDTTQSIKPYRSRLICWMRILPFKLVQQQHRGQGGRCVLRAAIISNVVSVMLQVHNNVRLFASNHAYLGQGERTLIYVSSDAARHRHFLECDSVQEMTTHPTTEHRQRVYVKACENELIVNSFAYLWSLCSERARVRRLAAPTTSFIDTGAGLGCINGVTAIARARRS